MSWPCCIATFFLLTLCSLAHAQSLPQALEKIAWDPQARGALLVVAPERDLRSVAPSAPPPVLPPPDRNQQWRLKSLEGLYARRLFSLESISVFAPATMHVLETSRLPKLNPFETLSPNERFRLLESTLDDSQWKKLASAAGLGASDLNAEQRSIFESLFPASLVVATAGSDETRALTASQRAGVRLSLFRRSSWRFSAADGSIRSPIEVPSGELWYLKSESDQEWADTLQGKLFGVTVVQKLPNRLKPTQLTLSAQSARATVLLDGANTVGELVARLGAAVHLPLYCDPRYAKLSVWHRGSSAQAGDLLKALCYGVTGTWRRVAAPGQEPLFVLTDDIRGLGTRYGQLARWATQNVSTLKALESQAKGKLAGPRNKFLAFSASDPMAQSPHLLQSFQEFQKRPPQTGTPRSFIESNLWFPLSELPAELQKRARATLEQSSKYLPPEVKLRDQLLFEFSDALSLVVPGLGSVEAAGLRGRSYFDGDDTLPAPPPPQLAPLAPLSSALKTRALMVTVTKAQELEQLIPLAKSRGFTALWISAPSALLERAVALGNAAGLAIHAVVAPEQAAADPKLPRGLNLLGETPGGLRYEDDSVPKAVVEALSSATQIPGIRGVVLHDKLPPGYRPTEGAGATWEQELGYSEPLRYESLRRGGADPLDLCPFSGWELGGGSRSYILENPSPLSLPWMPDNGSSIADSASHKKPFDAVRREIALSVRKRLTESLQSKSGALLISALNLPYYGSFEPELASRKPTPQAPLRIQAEATSKTVLSLLSFRPQRPPRLLFRDDEPLALRFQRALQEKQASLEKEGWEGFVLDLTELTIADAFVLLPLLPERRYGDVGSSPGSPSRL